MAQNLFSIDGTYYDVFVPMEGIKRSAQILDSDNTQRKQDGSMYRDIIGTYYNYTIEIKRKGNNVTDYDTVFNLLSQPTESHELTVPYGQTTLTFDAYISSVEDSLTRRENGVNYWDGMSLQFIAMDPYVSTISI